jgi:hypothetical protein
MNGVENLSALCGSLCSAPLTPGDRKSPNFCLGRRPSVSEQSPPNRCSLTEEFIRLLGDCFARSPAQAPGASVVFGEKHASAQRVGLAMTCW